MGDQVDVMTDDALGRDDVMELLHRIRRHEVSPAELMDAARARVAVANEQLNAVVSEVDVPSEDGPFAGIPTALKDNEDLQGYPTLRGSWAPAERAAEADSPWTAHFRALGFQPFVKTTMPEFGLTASTESSRYGATGNPWDVTRSAGGSSGGSAALVASGALPIAHANDGGGSIRIPASLCGLVGLKPSRGRLPELPEMQKLPVNLVTQGVLTRSVRDTAYFYAESERMFESPDLPPIGMVVRPERTRLRFGLMASGIPGIPVDPETSAAVLKTGEVLQSLGHEVTPIEPVMDEGFGRDFLRYWAMLAFLLQRGGSRMLGPGFDGARTEPLTKGLSTMFVQQAPRLPGSLRRLQRAGEQSDEIYSTYDVLLSPTVSHPAPELGWLGPEVPVHDQLVRLLRFASFTAWQNVTGAPAISLPLATSSAGLPIGVQVAAPIGLERRLLSVALELEEAMPWPLAPRPVR